MAELRSFGAASVQTGRGLAGPAGAAPVGAGPPFRVYRRLVSSCRQSGNNVAKLFLRPQASVLVPVMSTCDQCYKNLF